MLQVGVMKKHRLFIFVATQRCSLIFVWALIVLFVFLVGSFNIQPVLLQYALLLGVIVLLVIILDAYLKITFRRLLKVLTHQCDPEAYTKLHRTIAARLNAKKPAFQNELRVYISTGLIASGRYNDAFNVLLTMAPFNNNAKGLLTEAAYHNNITLLYLHQKDTDSATQHLNAVKQLMSTTNFAKKNTAIRLTMAMEEKLISMANGNYDGAEKALRDVFNNATTPYMKSTAMFSLGEMYAHLGQTDDAKAAFEYVCAHGNKLYAAKKAREYLQKVNNGETLSPSSLQANNMTAVSPTSS